ncbi:MAG: hypothetical protein LBP64_09790 [Tannerella sp.]|jgi:hypothetical protein|nr:hypothetical protein [Tannerella sp.]
MATHKDWIPKKHEALYNMALQTWSYLSIPENHIRMGFIADSPGWTWVTTVFVPALNTEKKAFEEWENPATRTTVITSKLAEAEKMFIPIYRMLYTGFLKSCPLVTDDDLIAMGLPQRQRKHKRASIPQKSPGAATDTSHIRRVKVHFYSADSAHKRGKPHGVRGAEMRWGIFDSAHGISFDRLDRASFGIRTPFVIDFLDEQRGKVFCFCIRWENTRGEKGPFGPMLSTIIP